MSIYVNQGVWQGAIVLNNALLVGNAVPQITGNAADLGGAITNADVNSVHKAIPFEVQGSPAGVDLAISVLNGVYSIDGGAQTSQPGTVQNGQLVEFWVTAAATPFTPVTGNVNIEGQESDFIVVTGDQTAVNEGVVFFVRDRDTDDLVVNTTIDVMVATEQFGGAPLYQADDVVIDSSGRLIIPLAGGELGRQVFVSGLLADGRYIAGNAMIVDITGL